MASPLERRERDKQELRTKILDAARELFVEHGYDAVTMRKVAERIEYTPTTIYLHFEDKDALIRELCQHDFRAFGARFAETLAIADPVSRLRQSGLIYFNFAREHPQHYRLMFMTPVPEASRGNAKSADPAEDAYGLLLGTVEQALKEGRLRPEHTDAALVAQTIWAASHGVVSLEIAKGNECGWITWRPLDDRVRLMIAVIIDAFVAPEAPAKAIAVKAPKNQPKRKRS